MTDIDAGALNRLWRRGRFPLSYLAPTETASFKWRRAFLRTFVERDLPQLGVRLAPQVLRRFWIHAGDYTFPMHERIRAVSACRLPTDVEPLPD